MDDENGSAANGTISTAISTPAESAYTGCTAQSSEELSLSTGSSRESETADGQLGTKRVPTDSIDDCRASSSPSGAENNTADAEAAMAEECGEFMGDTCETDEHDAGKEAESIQSNNVADAGEEIGYSQCSKSDVTEPNDAQSSAVQVSPSEKQKDMLETTETNQSHSSRPQNENEGETFSVKTEILSSEDKLSITDGKDPSKPADIEAEACSEQHEDQTECFTSSEADTAQPTNILYEDDGKPKANDILHQNNADVAEVSHADTDASGSILHVSGTDLFESSNKSQNKQQLVNEVEDITLSSTVIQETECLVNSPAELEPNIIRKTLDSVAEGNSLHKHPTDSNCGEHTAGSDDNDGLPNHRGDFCRAIAVLATIIEHKEKSVIKQENCMEANSLSSSLCETSDQASDRNWILKEVNKEESELSTSTGHTADTKMNGGSCTSLPNTYDEECPEVETTKQSLTNRSSSSRSSSRSSSTSSSGSSRSSSSSSTTNSNNSRNSNDSRSPSSRRIIKSHTVGVERVIAQVNDKWQGHEWMPDNMPHILQSVNPLKRRASDTPLEREKERMRRLSSGEMESKHAKLSTSSVPGSPEVSNRVLIGDHEPIDEDQLLAHPELSSEKELEDSKFNLEQSAKQMEEVPNCPSDDSGKHLISLGTMSDQSLAPNPSANPIDITSSAMADAGEISKDAAQLQHCPPEAVQETLQQEENEIAEGNVSSSAASSSSSGSSTSSSSSSSSSSDSESSGDEAEEVALSFPANEHMSADIQHELPLHSLHSAPVPMAYNETYTTLLQNQPTSEREVSEENTRDTAAMEIDESAGESEEEDSQETGSKRDDEVKITRSEGLKLSISLKRSSTVATPTRAEDFPLARATKATAVQSQQSLLPVDFSNFLKRELLGNESQELVKIDYNHVPRLNYSGHGLPSDAVPLSTTASEVQVQPQHPYQPVNELQQQRPAPWNNDAVSNSAGGNILKNTLKSNHLVGKLVNTISIVAPPSQEESSDTLDEDNRLVIAEKQQRRSRQKKTQQMSLLPPAMTLAPFPPEGMPRQEHPLSYSVHSLQQQLPIASTSVPHLLQSSNCRSANLIGDYYQAAYFPNLNNASVQSMVNRSTSSPLNVLKSIKPVPGAKVVANKRRAKRPPERRKASQTTIGGTATASDGSRRLPSSNLHKTMDGAFINQQQQQQQTDVQSRPNVKPPPLAGSMTAAGSNTSEGHTNQKKKDKKKVFLCSPCGTHYENWNLFLHMREVHRKHICLYCLGIFQSAERLVNHLGAKHGVQRKYHASLAEYLHLHQQHQAKSGTTLGNGNGDNGLQIANRSLLQQPFYLMCSRCEHMFESNVASNSLEERERHILLHNCRDYVQACGNCGQPKLSKHRCDVISTDGHGTSGAVERKMKISRKAMAPTGPEVNGVALNGGNLQNESCLKGTTKLYLEQTRRHQQHQQQQQQSQQLQHSIAGSILQSQLLKNQPVAATTTPTIPSVGHFKHTNHHQVLNHLQQPTNAFNLPVENHDLMHHPQVANGDHSREEEEGVLLATATATYPANEPNEPPSPTVEQPVDEPTPVAPPPLVPKLKVKIPIQYLTPMESEESSAESDEDNDEEEEDEEEEEEEERDQDEVANSGEEEVHGNGAEESENGSVVNEAKVESVESEHLAEEALDVKQNEPAEDGYNLTSVPPLDDPSYPEPIAMDIDETISAERKRDVPASVAATPSDAHALPLVKLSPTNASEDLLPMETTDTSQVEIKPYVEEQHDVSNAPGLQLEQTHYSPVLPSGTSGCGGEEKGVGGTAESDATKTGPSDDPLPMEEMDTTGAVVVTDMSYQDDDGLLVADSESPLFELSLDEPLDRIPVREFIKICLGVTVPSCLYCNHARRIAVCARQLVLHIIATHRFQATVNSITGEELLPETILLRFRGALEELDPEAYLNMETFDNHWTVERRASLPFVRQFECFQCRFVTLVHKELYLHNRKMHQKSVLVCLMCRGSFFSYSELLCHLCPGQANQMTILDYTFRCCVCNVDGIPSAFRLMVHLRKRHFACDVCLEECQDQGRLSNHVWKHKLHHLCYRCGIGYRNKADILKHLFWKHGTEGVVCKRCLQKKWPHVYHFCVPPAQFVCEVCQATFGRAVALKVHQRLHNGDARYPCTEDACDKRFISKKHLLKHVQRHFPELEAKEEVAVSAPLTNGEADVPAVDGEGGTISAKELPVEIKQEDAELAGEEKQRADVKPDDKEQHTEVKVDSARTAGEDITPNEDSNRAAKPTQPGDTGDTQKAIEVDTKGAAPSSENDQVPREPKAETEIANEKLCSSKKSKKKRKAKDDMMDLMNLPALNLSESDSSDDSDNDSSLASFSSRRFQEWANETECMNASEPKGGKGDTLFAESRSRRDPEESMGQDEKSVAGEELDDSVAGPPMTMPRDRRQCVQDQEDASEKKETASETQCLDPIANIWNNFKRYQAHNRTASRRQSADEEQRMEDELVEKMLRQTILHVSQSDHDYCMMFKPISAESETVESRSSEQESLLLGADRTGGVESMEEAKSASRKSHTPHTRRSPRKGTTSSDSGDSSDSDTSCECASNCSCSSSSSNSSSSSSDDSDSSAEESDRRKKKGGAETKESVTHVSSPGHGSGSVDRQDVTGQVAENELEMPPHQPEPQEPIDPDSVIVDSDLQTDESETDEEFYDEHPQKLANQMLAEKRRQLLAQTCAVTASGASSGIMSYGIVENSRPSTPSLPPEEQQEKKKLKMKKRKRERKSSKRISSSPQLANIPAPGAAGVLPVPLESVQPSSLPPPHHPTASTATHSWMEHHGSFAQSAVSGSSVNAHAPQRPPPNSMEQSVTGNLHSIIPPLAIPTQSGVIAGGGDAGRITGPRLSTGNSSESDAPLKRSQRSRKPNKFYGYTSDDEGAAASLALPGIPLSANPEKSILSLMKPTPPPNLVWSKEDLPSPPTKSSSGAGGSKGGATQAIQRRSVDHLTPFSSRRNSGVGMPLEEMGGLLPAGLIAQLASHATSSATTPDLLQRPPLPKLKLSLGKKSARTSLGTPKRGQINRRPRKATPRAPKTPKSAPPIAGLGIDATTLMLNSAAPLSAPVLPPAGMAGAMMYQPQPIDTRPKIPPIGSFPSVQTDMFRPSQIRVPAGWRAPREGESVYCYCRAPYDEVSEMIACDGENCRIEWFHFECVGIIMPPKGKWFCPECKLKQPPVLDDDADGGHHGATARGLLPHSAAPNGPSIPAAQSSASSSSSSSGGWGHQLPL